MENENVGTESLDTKYEKFQQNTTPSVSPLRTYQNDVKTSMEVNNTSAIQIALAEAKKRQTQTEDEPSPSKKTLFILLSILFILLGIGAFGFFAFYNKQKEEVPVVIIKKIITTDTEKNIDVSNLERTSVLELITNEKKRNTEVLGSTSKITLVKGNDSSLVPMGGQDFLSLLALNIPEVLLRSFQKDFVLGFHNLEKREPFILMKTDSYQASFAGLLSWERNMLFDMQEIFLDRTIAPESNSETFTDTVIANKDARVVRNEEGRIIFLYTFLDNETLLFTTNTLTVREIAERLRASKLIR